MPPHDKKRDTPLEPRIQEIRNHYVNANYVRGFDGRLVKYVFIGDYSHYEASGTTRTLAHKGRRKGP